LVPLSQALTPFARVSQLERSAISWSSTTPIIVAVRADGLTVRLVDHEGGPHASTAEAPSGVGQGRTGGLQDVLRVAQVNFGGPPRRAISQ
jgi:hypothetical protein